MKLKDRNECNFEALDHPGSMRNVSSQRMAASVVMSIASSWAEQFHSDASLEKVDRRVPNKSKNWQWTMECVVSARQSTPVPHGGE
ncbi:hypothetical protein TNCV_2274611 [Trichonephila clavipes]|nr:hypothetical protein TNCV_2274611 [Trichonephila clavipes]